jgi:sec-independent protein translocase protein TatA
MIQLLEILPQLLISMPGGTELIIIAILIIILFGAKKLPGLGRGIGQGIKEFKDAKNNGNDKETNKEEKRD